MRQPRAGSMQSNHVPSRLREMLDEIETDETRTARDEGGFFSHELPSTCYAAPIESYSCRDGRAFGPSVPNNVSLGPFIELGSGQGLTPSRDPKQSSERHGIGCDGGQVP